MSDKRYILLLTACINPPASNVKKYSIDRASPLIRLNDYKTALHFWLTYKEPLLAGIVFVENSGFDLTELKSLAAHSNVYNKEIEFLQYKAQAIPEGLHYGFSELEMIDKAIDNSTLIKSQIL